MPRPVGYDPNGNDTADELVGGATAPYNFTVQHPLVWMQSCFVGRRGSTRIHVNSMEVDHSPQIISVERDPTSSANNGLYSPYSGPVGGDTHDWRRLFQGLSSGSSGMIVSNGNVQPCISFEFPLYSKRRFVSASPEYNVAGSSVDDTLNHVVVHKTITMPVEESTGSSALEVYQSIGTDFTFLYYLNAPTLAYYAKPGIP